ncbi:MAG: polysaccharide deacetylase family protein [Candidatus Omnitrophica bacterium]|nr:polysaccharide deacetylase family protein [Candidatus Omnitrophota bacterium]
MFKRKRLVILLSIPIIAFLFIAGYFKQNYVVPIIMYHSVSPDANPKNRLAVTPETFDRQMRFLKNNHYNVVSLEVLSRLIKEKKKIPPKTIAITFDDGYRDNYAYAFPVLKKYNLCATLFIIVNEVGRPQADRLNWDEIKVMQDSGVVNVASHGLGPDPLIKIKSEGELKREIFESKRLLQEKLAADINAFSYPEGMFDAKIRQLVIDAGYALAVATNPGPEYPDDDIFALKRLRISENASNMFIFAVETSGFYTFMKEFKKSHRRHKAH